LLLDELGVDVVGVVNGGFDAVPFETVVVPDGVEEAGLAAGRAEEPEMAVGAGGGTGDVAENFVVDHGGFVDDDDIDGVAEAGLHVVGDGEDFGAVGEFDGVLFAAGAALGDAKRGSVGDDFFDDDAGAVFTIGEDEDFRFRVIDGVVEGFDGDDGGFSPLAGAAEDEAVGFVVEDFDLFGLGLEVEGGFGPLAGFFEGFWYFRTHFG
jgi:hypothetical protein